MLKLSSMTENRGADLKELHPDAGKHELQQRGDDHDVADGSDSNKHALHYMLQETGRR